jgi:hypothetical protein
MRKMIKNIGEDRKNRRSVMAFFSTNYLLAAQQLAQHLVLQRLSQLEEGLGEA